MERHPLWPIPVVAIAIVVAINFTEHPGTTVSPNVTKDRSQASSLTKAKPTVGETYGPKEFGFRPAHKIGRHPSKDVGSLFAGFSSSMTQEDLENLSAEIVSEARASRIDLSDVLSYAMSHYESNSPLFVFMIIENLGGIGGGEANQIIRSVAVDNPGLAVELTLRFGSGQKFERGVDSILGSIDLHESDLSKRVGEIRTKYEDLEDLQVVDDCIQTWLGLNGSNLSKAQLVSMCNPDEYGKGPSSKAWTLLWARGDQTVEAAIDLISMNPVEVPPGLLTNIANDLVKSEAPIEETLKVGSQIKNDSAKLQFAFTLLNSESYFRINLLELSGYISQNKEVLLQNSTFASKLIELPQETWLPALSAFDTETRDRVLMSMAHIYLQTGDKSGASSAISQISDTNKRQQSSKNLGALSRP